VVAVLCSAAAGTTLGSQRHFNLHSSAGLDGTKPCHNLSFRSWPRKASLHIGRSDSFNRTDSQLVGGLAAVQPAAAAAAATTEHRDVREANLLQTWSIPAVKMARSGGSYEATSLSRAAVAARSTGSSLQAGPTAWPTAEATVAIGVQRHAGEARSWSGATLIQRAVLHWRRSSSHSRFSRQQDIEDMDMVLGLPKIVWVVIVDMLAVFAFFIGTKLVASRAMRKTGQGDGGGKAEYG